MSEFTLSLANAARRAGIHPNTLRAWADTGKVPVVRSGVRGDRRFRPDDIDDLSNRLGAAAVAREARDAVRAVTDSPGFALALRQQAELGRRLTADFAPLARMFRERSNLASIGLMAQDVADLQKSLAFTVMPALASLGAAQRAVLQQAAAFSSVADSLLAIQAQQQQTAAAFAVFRAAALSAPVWAASVAPAIRAIADAAALAERVRVPLFLVQQAQLSVVAHGSFSERAARVDPKSESEARVMAVEQETGGHVLDLGIQVLYQVAKQADLPGSGDGAPVQPSVFAALAAELDQRKSELLGLSRPELSLAIDQLLVVRIARAAARFVQLRYAVSRAAQLLDGEATFKPTTKSELLLAALPVLVVRSSDDFARLAGMSYELVYEASGEYQRFPLSFWEARPIFMVVKRLRRWWMHDLEHGHDSEVRQKLRQTADTFTQLIGQPAPISERDYQRAQLALLEGLNSALQDFLSYMSPQG